MINKIMEWIKNFIVNLDSFCSKKEFGVCDKPLGKEPIEENRPKAALKPFKINTSIEDAWNNKWPKAKGIYRARNGRKYDIRNFIWKDDAILKDLILAHKLKGIDIKEFQNDISAFKCMKFVKDNIKYVPDPVKPHPEHWKFPVETLHDKHGDCDDSSLLLASLCLNCGIPAYRIKVALGWANSGKNTKEFYHAYCIYLREYDNEWVVIDTNSADVNEFDIWKRVKAKDNPYYKSPDKTFNNEFCWAQKDFEVNPI